MIGKMMTRLTTACASLALTAAGGFGVMGATATAADAAATRPAFTPTCVACTHVQNRYAFRGALDAIHQGTAINTPIVLWFETPTTTDPGADLLVKTVTSSITGGHVNQSSLHWNQYNGDSVVRFLYSPYGNGGADTYVGLNGTSLALRADNPNSIWQEFIEVPVDANGFALPNTPNACKAPAHCVLIDVGQTANPNDPEVATDPGDAFTGSGVQQDVEHQSLNQFNATATNQVWQFQN